MHRHPEWRYIAYDVLKQMLRSPHSGSFLDTLLNEIEEVDAFFQRLDGAAKGEQLATFAMLNHLAVKTILQKHAKIYSSALDSQRNAEFWRRLCESVVFMSKAITLSRKSSRQVCEILEPLASLECLESSFVAPEISEMVPKTSRLRIMTWNACAISFPLQIHPLKFLLGLFLGRWWHDACYDAPMEINNGSAQLRYARQADYIRHAGADLVLLQEVLSTSMLDSLMLHLSEEFDCTYLRCHPRIPSMVLWTCFLLSMGALQSLFLQILVPLVPWSRMRWFCSDLFWTWLLVALCLSMSLAIRWRHSIPAHFLFGNIAGQLVVLRRKNCEAIAGLQAESFDHFGDLQRSRSEVQATRDRPSWLGVFFNLRPRGVLRVSVPLEHGKRMTVLNTHLPHQSDNTKLLCDLGSYASKFAAKGPVLLAGDFNPLPDVCLSQQLEPLLQCGLVSADGLSEQNCTWDLQQSLTRRNASTPRTMQLDFIFLQDQRNAELVEAPAMPEDDVDVSARKSLLEIDPLDPLDLEGSLLCSTKALEITVMSTAIVDREKFFRSEAPLSDHFGLRTEIELSG